VHFLVLSSESQPPEEGISFRAPPDLESGRTLNRCMNPITMSKRKLTNRIASVSLAMFTLIAAAHSRWRGIFKVKKISGPPPRRPRPQTTESTTPSTRQRRGADWLTFPREITRGLHSSEKHLTSTSATTPILAASSGYDAPESNPFDNYQDFGHSHFITRDLGRRLPTSGSSGPARSTATTTHTSAPSAARAQGRVDLIALRSNSRSRLINTLRAATSASSPTA